MRAEIPAIAGRAAATALWIGIGVAGVPGCVAGGATGGVAGAAVGGPLGAVGGAIDGCVFGGAAAITAATPEIVATTAATAGITYGWERWEAKRALKLAMAACQEIT